MFGGRCSVLCMAPLDPRLAVCDRGLLTCARWLALRCRSLRRKPSLRGLALSSTRQASTDTSKRRRVRLSCDTALELHLSLFLAHCADAVRLEPPPSPTCTAPPPASLRHDRAAAALSARRPPPILSTSPPHFAGAAILSLYLSLSHLGDQRNVAASALLRFTLSAIASGGKGASSPRQPLREQKPGSRHGQLCCIDKRGRSSGRRSVHRPTSAKRPGAKWREGS